MEKANTYLSSALEEKLRLMLKAPFGIIVAPAGYGKTTAALAALHDIPQTQQHWFTAEKRLRAYENELYNWFVSESASIQPQTAKQLSEQGFFNRANRYDISRIIREMTVDTQQYIIIDNLQYLSDDFSDVLISSLAENPCKNLHLVIITQYLSSKRIRLLDKADCFYLRSFDLMLSCEEIQDYANKINVVLTNDQVSRLWKQTEGWMIIVSLYLKRISESGNVPETSDVNSVMYEICWKTLDHDEQCLLLYFSVWQTIRRCCLDYLISEENLPFTDDNIRSLMYKIPLIKYDSLSDSFTMHNILQEYVVLRFHEAQLPIKNKVSGIAGRWEQSKGNHRAAVTHFYRAKLYDELLSCNLNNMLMEDFDGASFSQIAHDIYLHCENEILAKHPISALKICYALYAAAKFDAYNSFLERLHSIILKLNNNQLLGEWLLVSAFQVFPDIGDMTAVYKEAQKLMTHKSELFTYKEPYLFGCTSMWYLYYSKIGCAEALADELDSMIALYNYLTDEHAAGAEMLYRGEVYCVEGRFEEAEILAHTAANLAQAKKNVSVTYGASLLLGIIAIYRDDTVGIESAIKYLEKYAAGYDFMQNTALNKYMTETVRGYLLGLLMETQDTSDWVREQDFPGAELTFTNFMVKTAQITHLILHKEYKKAIANVEASLTLDRRLISLPTQNFMHVGLALCYLAIGNVVKASQNLEISLSLAEQDQNFTFLACFRRYLAPLMLLPNVRKGHTKAIEQIKALKLNYTIVEKKAIFDALLQENTSPDDLTEREAEIARLAADGMRNKEIAETLCISEYTVKNHLSVIYQKLNIDRRSKLIEMLK